MKDTYKKITRDLARWRCNAAFNKRPCGICLSCRARKLLNLTWEKAQER